MERDLTTGSIGRNILKFSLPYFLSYFLQTLYGMADLFIIGQFNGVASTTAVSIGSQVMHMITVMIVGIAMGTTVMIGKSVGAKQKKETSKIIGNTVSLFVCLSVSTTERHTNKRKKLQRSLEILSVCLYVFLLYLQWCYYFLFIQLFVSCQHRNRQ